MPGANAGYGPLQRDTLPRPGRDRALILPQWCGLRITRTGDATNAESSATSDQSHVLIVDREVVDPPLVRSNPDGKISSLKPLEVPGRNRSESSGKRKTALRPFSWLPMVVRYCGSCFATCCAMMACAALVGWIPSQNRNSSGLWQKNGATFGVMHGSVTSLRPKSAPCPNMFSTV